MELIKIHCATVSLSDILAELKQLCSFRYSKWRYCGRLFGIVTWLKQAVHFYLFIYFFSYSRTTNSLSVPGFEVYRHQSRELGCACLVSYANSSKAEGKAFDKGPLFSSSSPVVSHVTCQPGWTAWRPKRSPSIISHVAGIGNHIITAGYVCFHVFNKML